MIGGEEIIFFWGEVEAELAVPAALRFALPMKLRRERIACIVSVVLSAARIRSPSAGFAVEKKEIRFNASTSFCLAQLTWNGSSTLLYLCVETVAVKDVRNGDS